MYAYIYIYISIIQVRPRQPSYEATHVLYSKPIVHTALNQRFLSLSPLSPYFLRQRNTIFSGWGHVAKTNAGKHLFNILRCGSAVKQKHIEAKSPPGGTFLGFHNKYEACIALEGVLGAKVPSDN